MHPNRRQTLVAFAALPASVAAQEPKPNSRAAERYRLESWLPESGNEHIMVLRG